MTAHSANRAATGAARFTQQTTQVPRRSRAGAAFSGLALLALIAGVPAGLYLLAAPLLEQGRLSGDLLPDGALGTVGIDQVLAVLVVIAALAWLQFVICVLVELGAALRGGVLAAPVPLSGPSQRLARWLVGSMLLVGVMAGQVGVAQAATGTGPGPVRAGTVATSTGYAVSSDPDTFYVFDANTAAPQTEQVSHVTSRQAAAQAANARRDAAAGRSAPSREELALDGHKVYVVAAPTGRHHDTLWEIAERHLGDGRRYHEIYRLNEGRLQPDGRTLHLARLIQPGWRLIMPEDAVGVSRWVADRGAGDAVAGRNSGSGETADSGQGSGDGQTDGAAPTAGAAGSSTAAANDPTTSSVASSGRADPATGSASATGGSAAAAAPARPRASASTGASTTAAGTTTATTTAPTARASSAAAGGSTADGGSDRATSGRPEATGSAQTGQGQVVLPTDPTPPRGTNPGLGVTSSARPTRSSASPSSAAASATAPPSAAGSSAGTNPQTSPTAESTSNRQAPGAIGTGATASARPTGIGDGFALPGELIAAGLVTAGLLGTLLLIRRRRRGGQDQPGRLEQETEVWLRTGADADRGALLDLALRSLPRACREAALPLPQAYGSVVDNDGLDLLLTMAHPSAPPPWEAFDDGLRWRLTYTDAQHLVAHGDSAYPLLTSVGRDQQGRDALINLGAAAGPVAIVGSPAMAAAVVRALALGLAGNPWSRGIAVLTADLPAALPTIAAGRLTPCEGAGDLTDQIEQGSTRMPRTGPVRILTGGPAPGSRPERVAVYGAPLNLQTAARLQAVVGRGADLAVLVAGDLPGARWRLQVDDSGFLTCEELSLQVSANRLGDGSIDRLRSLFVSAGTPDSPTASGPEGERVARPDGVVEADDITWAQAPARISVLGEVQIHAPGRIDPHRSVVAEEILAYLALHPLGTHPTVLGSAIWPRGVTADVRDEMIEEVRDWLGTDESGRPRLNEGNDGRLRLSAGVPCDWDVLRTLLERSDRTADRIRERDLLVRALHLIRGPLVGGIAHGTYTWLPRTGLERQSEQMILDAASRLCRLASEDGDQMAVEQAATAGLRAVPHAQHLWRYIIRAEFSLGGPARLRDVADHVRFVLASSGVDMEPETSTLIEHLAGTEQTPEHTGTAMF